jgi:L-ascorbate metabolism protein UlaG (beta-lactamase superfamily)
MEEFRPGRLTHVFVTHGHPGHWGRGDSADIAALCGVPLFAPRPLAEHIRETRAASADVRGVEDGWMFSGEGVSAEFRVCPHPESPVLSPEDAAVPSEPNGLYRFTLCGHTVVHVGDGLPDPVFDDMRKKGPSVDLACLPLWGAGMAAGMEDALARLLRIVEALRPARVACHNRFDPGLRAWNALHDRFAREFPDVELLPQRLDEGVAIS